MEIIGLLNVTIILKSPGYCNFSKYNFNFHLINEKKSSCRLVLRCIRLGLPFPTGGGYMQVI
jgi:hypothetical protein